MGKCGLRGELLSSPLPVFHRGGILPKAGASKEMNNFANKPKRGNSHVQDVRMRRKEIGFLQFS